MSRFLAALFCLFTLTPLAAQENVTVRTNVDHAAVASRIADEFVVPLYAALLERTETQFAAWTAFCAAGPPSEGFAPLIPAFTETVDAWARVELVRYGPVSENFRYERIAYWPERKNDVARGVTRLLTESDVLTPEAMPAKSVAVQGLSALERLLYEDGAREALFAGGAAGKRRCAAGAAISGNLRNVVAEIVAAWAPLRQKLKSADAAFAREAVTRFATDLLTLYQVVGDQKLDIPMGKTVAEAKPKAAQWWRSGLSSQTLAFNLQSAADLTWIVLGPGDEGTSTVGAIETGKRLAEDLPFPLPEMVENVEQRKSLLLLRDAVRGGRDLSGTYVPPALGITLGFNSLDGD